MAAHMVRYPIAYGFCERTPRLLSVFNLLPADLLVASTPTMATLFSPLSLFILTSQSSIGATPSVRIFIQNFFHRFFHIINLIRIYSFYNFNIILFAILSRNPFTRSCELWVFSCAEKIATTSSFNGASKLICSIIQNVCVCSPKSSDQFHDILCPLESNAITGMPFSLAASSMFLSRIHVSGLKGILQMDSRQLPHQEY